MNAKTLAADSAAQAVSYRTKLRRFAMIELACGVAQVSVGAILFLAPYSPLVLALAVFGVTLGISSLMSAYRAKTDGDKIYDTFMELRQFNLDMAKSFEEEDADDDE
jgi:hypothetical protein